MATSIVSSQPASEGAVPAVWRAGLPTSIFALMPLWVLIIVATGSPSFVPAMAAEYPSIVGIGLGAIVEGIALFWMLLGVAVVWRARTQLVESLALTVFTVPAAVAVVVAPAAVLIMQNLD